MAGAARAPTFADGTAVLTAAPATGGNVPSAASVGGALASSAVAAASGKNRRRNRRPAVLFLRPHQSGGQSGRASRPLEQYNRRRKRRRHRRPAVLLPLLRRWRGRLESSRQQLGLLVKSAARGGRPPTPLTPVPYFCWRSATVATSLAAAVTTAGAAAATTTPATTTSGGMQPVLEHCRDPLIRGSDAGGVRGEERRFLVFMSLLTAGRNGGECSMEGDGLSC